MEQSILMECKNKQIEGSFLKGKSNKIKTSEILKIVYFLGVLCSKNTILYICHWNKSFFCKLTLIALYI